MKFVSPAISTVWTGFNEGLVRSSRIQFLGPHLIDTIFRRSLDTELLYQEPTWYSQYSYYITPYEPRFECPPEVQVNLGAEGSIGRWNLLPRMRSKQGNDKLIFGALFRKPLKTLIEPAQPKSDIGRLSSAWHRSCFSSEVLVLVLFKPPDKSFASKVINLGVVNVRTKI